MADTDKEEERLERQEGICKQKSFLSILVFKVSKTTFFLMKNRGFPFQSLIFTKETPFLLFHGIDILFPVDFHGFHSHMERSLYNQPPQPPAKLRRVHQRLDEKWKLEEKLEQASEVRNASGEVGGY